jgi:rRNA methylases
MTNSKQKPLTPERRLRMEQVLAFRQPDLTLVLSNIHDPHNVSAIYRSCDAFGIDEVHLYYTDTEFPELGRKSSASARKWVDTHRHRDLNTLKNALKKKGCQILATSCSPTAKPLADWDFTRPTAVIMGNEHRGVDKEIINLADGELYIPMHGMIQSFNVSVAAAIILSEACRQRKQAGMYDRPSLSEAEIKARIEMWRNK